MDYSNEFDYNVDVVEEEEEEEVVEIGEENENINKTVNISSPPSVFSNIRLTPYERTAIICKRAEQLDKGRKPAINTKETDTIKIAMMELEQGLVPLILIRIYPRGFCQKIKLFGKKMIS